MLTHGPHMNADAFMQWAREQRLDSKREALERKREARRKALERRHKYSKDVAGALSVVAALIASALLTVLLGPSPLVLDHGSWDPSDSTSPIMNPTPGSNSTTIVVINTGATSGIDVACYSTCWAWRRAYGVAASLSLALVLAALVVALSVAIGVTSWLELSLFFFSLSLFSTTVIVIAAAWLTTTRAVAIVSTAVLSFFMVLSLVFLSPALVMVRFKVWPPRKIEVFYEGTNVTVDIPNPLAWLILSRPQSQQEQEQRQPLPTACCCPLLRRRPLPGEEGAAGDAERGDVAAAAAPTPAAIPAVGLFLGKSFLSIARFLKGLLRTVFLNEKLLVKVFLLTTDVNERDEYGSTLMLLAVGLGKSEAVKWLLEGGADPNVPRRKPAVTPSTDPMDTISPIQLAVLQYTKIDPPSDELWYKVAVVLLDSELVDPNEDYGDGRKLVDVSQYKMAWLLRRRGGVSCTEDGSMGAAEFVRRFLEPSVKAGSTTWLKLLVRFCTSGHARVVEEILPHVDDLSNFVGRETAVTAAARAGFVGVVRALRTDVRCDPTARNQAGQTPLEIAQEDFPDVEKELLTWEAEWKKQLSSGGAGRGDSAGSVSAGSASGPGQGRVSSADGDSMRSGSGAGAGTAPPATGE